MGPWKLARKLQNCACQWTISRFVVWIPNIQLFSATSKSFQVKVLYKPANQRSSGVIMHSADLCTPKEKKATSLVKQQSTVGIALDHDTQTSSSPEWRANQLKQIHSSIQARVPVEFQSGLRSPDSRVATSILPTFFRRKGYLLGLPQRLPSIDAGFQFVTPKIIQLWMNMM